MKKKPHERQGDFGPKRSTISGNDLRAMASNLQKLSTRLRKWATALDDLGTTTEMSRGNYDNALRRLEVWMVQQVEKTIKLAAIKAGREARDVEGR